ncbi:type IV pilus modification PilV family protein [Crocosphaera sp. Alani8]|uniref:type IV pilus modification PilV family protein n=1 Tax=Crocosphaera sp. Alani8 TaxID=3038952 RepID=UPI00313EC049
MNKILFKLILNPSKQKNDQGFSLFEVSIAILVSSAFLMGTLQAMTINAVLQVKSERQAQANFLIQQDLETIQATANGMNLKYLENSSLLNPSGKTETEICQDFFATNNADDRFGAYLVRELENLLSIDGKSDTVSAPTIDVNKVFSEGENFKQFQTDSNGNLDFSSGGQAQLESQPEKDSDGSDKKVVVQIINNTDLAWGHKKL